MGGVIKEFRTFLLRGNIVDLAVAVVIGAAFGAVVDSLVKDIITPIIGAIGGQPDFSALHFTINKSQFNYGSFINALISFVLVAAAIFFVVVKPMTAMLARIKRGEATDETASENLPPTWEYQTAGSGTELNKLGGEGWEVAGVSAGPNGAASYLLKRPRSSVR
ncbi:MAG: large conductance mechanosensitive channel protein MscL [Thermomicrobiales bacterium]